MSLIPYAGAPKRPKRRDPRKAAEVDIHCAIVKLLQLKAKPSLIYFHVPNGERRDKITAAKLKRMGVRAGVPDLVFVLPGGCAGFMEVKSDSPRLSPEQREFIEDSIALGARCTVVRSVDEAEAVLSTWGVLKGSVARAA